MKIVNCLIFSLLISFLCGAQESTPGNWLILFGNKPLNQKYNWHHEVQYRNYNALGDLEQLLLRTGIGMNVTDHANVLLGYGFIRSENYTQNDDKTIVNEHRIYQQVIAKQKIKRLGLQHRYRFEQRFIEDDFKLRCRYFLSLAHPIWKDAHSFKEFYVSTYNEIFLNTKSNVFDRNRLYGGLGYKINENIRLEIGYMNQFLNAGSRDQTNLICFLNW